MSIRELMERAKTMQGRYGQGYVEALEEIEREIREQIEQRVKELEWAISHMAHMKMERMDGAIGELRWMLEGDENPRRRG
jgi:hypothetical protein